jgi:hypothetical protein
VSRFPTIHLALQFAEFYVGSTSNAPRGEYLQKATARKRLIYKDAMKFINSKKVVKSTRVSVYPRRSIRRA